MYTTYGQIRDHDSLRSLTFKENE